MYLKTSTTYLHLPCDATQAQITLPRSNNHKNEDAPRIFHLELAENFRSNNNKKARFDRQLNDVTKAAVRPRPSRGQARCGKDRDGIDQQSYGRNRARGAQKDNPRSQKRAPKHQ